MALKVKFDHVARVHLVSASGTVDLASLYADGVKVWPTKPPPGFVEIDGDTGVIRGESQYVTGSNGSYVFTRPYGYGSVDVCMIGGGGSGAMEEAYSNHIGGGHAGEIKSQSVVLSSFQMSITLGEGGARQPLRRRDGYSGTSSFFGNVEAVGGIGGKFKSRSYEGMGASHTNCMGVFTDGQGYGSPFINSSYGGQAGFANGSDSVRDSNSLDAARGAGTGAAWRCDNCSNYTGKGGNGFIRISWS